MPHYLIYISEFIILLITETIYIRYARKHRMHEPLSPRSSHKTANVVRSGGFIFYIAIFAVLFLLKPDTMHHSYFFPGFIVGATVLAITSFIDDCHPIAPGIRLMIQSIVFIAVFRDLLEIGHPESFIIAVICGIGFTNAYNFMDGINGMLGAYSAVTLTTLYILFIPLTEQLPVISSLPSSLCISLLIATGVFLLFNFRHKAICFAGDVGSIVLGFLISFITICYVIFTGEASIITIFAVYGVDTIYTIIYRLFLGEDIFTSHRRHLYQIMTNNKGCTHLKTATGYALVQAVINIPYILMPQAYRISYLMFVIFTLSVAYFQLRRFHGKNPS